MSETNSKTKPDTPELIEIWKHKQTNAIAGVAPDGNVWRGVLFGLLGTVISVALIAGAFWLRSVWK